MKHTLIFWVILNCCVFITQKSEAQCYVRLEDASDFNSDEYQPVLQEAASKLCQIFDSTNFAGQFKVYDFGFYLHNESTIGGYPEPFAQKISEVKLLSPYYLLIGKQTDKTGVYTGFWIDLNLPDSLLCTGPIQEPLLSDNIKWAIEDQYQKDGQSPHLYAKAEVIGLTVLKDKIADLIICCDQAQNRNTQICSDCPTDEDIRKLLIGKGFKMANIDDVSINIPPIFRADRTLSQQKMMSSGLIDGVSEISITIDGVPWDLNQGLTDELSSYPQVSKKGVVASNEDMCLTDLYEKIKSDYYKTFEVAIIEFVWTKKDNQGNIVDKKFFFKNYFPSPVFDRELVSIPQNELPIFCHPDLGFLNYNCSPNPLPEDLTNVPNGKYVISTEVGGTRSAGFFYDASQFHWDQSDIVEYEDPLDAIQPDRDNISGDCNEYADPNQWSNFARRMRLEDTKVLVQDFERWTNHNPLVGLTSDLTTIVNHYYHGGGTPLVWACNSQFSKYIGTQLGIKNFLQYFQDLCYNWLLVNGTFENFIESNSDNIGAQLPRNIPAPAASAITNATAAIAIGGIQGWDVSIISLKRIPCTSSQYVRCYEVELHLTLMDIFGAGTDDRDRGGPWDSQLPFADNRIPGLTQMWLLQHCRNWDCQPVGGVPPCFVPFEHYVNFGHKFKLCYETELGP